jgi:4-amino-4-deoxy-L-arabinose transferase-like glycosyltransferase
VVHPQVLAGRDAVSISVVSESTLVEDSPETDAPAGSSELDRHTFRIAFGAIVAFAGALRIAYVLLAKRDEEVIGDQLHYFAQAATIADGRWFEHPWVPGTPSALHAPLTSLALAPVSWVDSNLILTQRLTMAIYGTLVVAGLGLLARVLFSRWISIVATMIAAVYANLWINDALIMSETFAAAGVVAVLLAAYAYQRRVTRVAAAVIGLALGLAGLARAELLLLGLILVVPLTLLQRDRSWRTRMAHLAIAGGAAVMVVSPWVIRNQIRFDEPVFMSTQDGLTVLGANCPETYSGSALGFWFIACASRVEPQVPEGADESVRSTVYRQAGVDYIRGNLDRVPVVVVARLGRGFSVWAPNQTIRYNQFEGRESWASKIGLWQYWILLPLAGYGLWLWPSNRPRWPLVVTALLSVITIATLYGIPRFRIPAEIGIVICASVALVALGQRFSMWRHQRSEVTIS